MPSVAVNIRHIKKCAFCKYWNDPTNSAIVPKSPAIGLWEIKNINQKCICFKKNIPMPANGFCNNDYEQKL
jgi:hypothetical protein